MISIIISSYQPHYFDCLQQNIEETCGIPYEIIKIENPKVMGICEAYNKGASQAKFNYFLFIHEDTLFVSKNWGSKLIKTLNLQNCGVVGVAGGTYYSFIPASWSLPKYSLMNFIQVEDSVSEKYNNTFQTNQKYAQVKAVDGVFLACTKNIFEQFQFNEEIKGFHGYDFIFSLSVAKKYNNYITNEILIKHFSSGTYSREWFQNLLEVRNRIGLFPEQKIDSNAEVVNFQKLIFNLKRFNYSKFQSLTIIFRYFPTKRLCLVNNFKMLLLIRHLI